MCNANQFNTQLKNDLAPLSTDLSVESSTLFIAFGGIVGGLGIPPFEFFNLTSDFNIRKVYIRDLFQSWYHAGLPGIQNGIDGTADFLNAIITDHNIDKLIVAGNSMGGYASILYGTLLNADIVLAFSPQTFISKNLRIQHNDFRWNDNMNMIYSEPSINGKYFDLKKVVLSANNSNTRIDVYFSKADPLDCIHADHLAECKNVNLYPFTEGGHELIKYLRDSGKLKSMLQRAIG